MLIHKNTYTYTCICEYICVYVWMNTSTGLWKNFPFSPPGDGLCHVSAFVFNKNKLLFGGYLPKETARHALCGIRIAFYDKRKKKSFRYTHIRPLSLSLSFTLSLLLFLRGFHSLTLNFPFFFLSFYYDINTRPFVMITCEKHMFFFAKYTFMHTYVYGVPATHRNVSNSPCLSTTSYSCSCVCCISHTYTLSISLCLSTSLYILEGHFIINRKHTYTSK